MDATHILCQLDKVKSSGSNKWLACCPAHDDKTPSLAIKDAGDRILLHCFAGCAAVEIVHALGMHWGDLFLESLSPELKERYRRAGLEKEADHHRVILMLAQSDIGNHKAINNTDVKIIQASMRWMKENDFE